MSVDRKSQILSEATNLFSHYGFDKVTIKQLAGACGISEPALYRYFKSKDDIYDEVLDSLKSMLKHEKLFDQLEDEDSLDDIMNGIAKHIITFFKANKELYRLLLFSALRQHRKARQVFREIRMPYVKYLLKRFDQLYSESKIIKKNNEITARCFVGMVFDCALGTTLWKGYQGKDYEPENIIANNVPIFIKGLSSLE